MKGLFAAIWSLVRLAVLGLGLWGSANAAGLYRCVIDGKVEFRDLPCPGTAQQSGVLTLGGTPAQCTGSLDDAMRHLGKDGQRFVAELQKACPGAKVSDSGTVTVVADGRLRTFRVEPASPQDSAGTEEVVDRYRSFIFDGFQWRLMSVKRFDRLGPDSNPQKPENGSFVLVEFELKNVSGKPRYYGSMVLVGGGTQFPSSSVKVYAKEQMRYESNGSTQFEPGVSLKTYEVFDAKFFSDYVLVIKEWVGSRRIRLKIS